MRRVAPTARAADGAAAGAHTRPDNAASASNAAIPQASTVLKTLEIKVARNACGHWVSNHKARHTEASRAGAKAQYKPGSSGPKISSTGKTASQNLADSQPN
jgi:hypothetical protein